MTERNMATTQCSDSGLSLPGKELKLESIVSPETTGKLPWRSAVITDSSSAFASSGNSEGQRRGRREKMTRWIVEMSASFRTHFPRPTNRTDPISYRQSVHQCHESCGHHRSSRGHLFVVVAHTEAFGAIILAAAKQLLIRHRTYRFSGISRLRAIHR